MIIQDCEYRLEMLNGTYCIVQGADTIDVIRIDSVYGKCTAHTEVNGVVIDDKDVALAGMIGGRLFGYHSLDVFRGGWSGSDFILHAEVCDVLNGQLRS